MTRDDALALADRILDLVNSQPATPSREEMAEQIGLWCGGYFVEETEVFVAHAQDEERVLKWDEPSMEEAGSMPMPSVLLLLLQALYASEINVAISAFWDSGWEVSIGDELNGFAARKNFDNDKLDQAVEWLVTNAKAVYPDSVFAKGRADKPQIVLITKRASPPRPFVPYSSNRAADLTSPAEPSEAQLWREVHQQSYFHRLGLCDCASRKDE